MAGFEITINGETHSKKEWCRIYGVSDGGIRYRMSRGETFEEALQNIATDHKPMNPMKVGKKEPAKLKTSEVDNRKCRTCKDRGRTDGEVTCDYILNHCHRRPCPPGEKCTVYEFGNRKRRTEAQIAIFESSFGGR